MKDSRVFFFLFFLVFIAIRGDYPSAEHQGISRIEQPAVPLYKKGEILVKFRDGVVTSKSQSLHTMAGTTLKRRFARLNIELVKLPSGVATESALEIYRKSPEVAYAEPNYIVKKAIIPNDPYFNLQWGLYNTGQVLKGIGGTPGADVKAPEAWDIHTGANNVIVAVVDSGVDYNHPDLSSNIWTNTGEICNNGLDDDKNGYIDDCLGWNFAYNNNNPMDDDVDGHGTHVAGVIGALGNNQIGVSGVNWKVKIMALKSLDSEGSGTMANVLEAINYAVTMGAKVINASYTYPQSCIKISPSLSERDAIKAAGEGGVLFIAAAGNYGCNNDIYPFYPASHPLPNIISVAASDQNDDKPSWSNYGARSVHVGAPGVAIYSTVRTTLGSYGYITGTSMATPFVSGLAGLILSRHADYTYSEIKEVILNSVDKKAGFTNKVISGGRINAKNALNALPLAPPSGLSAIVLSTSEITLSWSDNSSYERGFKIERKIGADGLYTEVATVGANVTTYNDTGLMEATTYYYRVKAYNNGGDSPYSNEVMAQTLPSAPSGLSASALSTSQINLSWTDNSAGEIGFKIERKTGADGLYTEVATVGANITTYNDTGLMEATTYYYRVKAYNNGGDSTYSNEAMTTTFSPSSGGCFIATAAYGSYMDYHVQVLREFRDKYLLTNYPGRALVSLYYRISPPIAQYISEQETIRTAVRYSLTIVVFGVKYPLVSVLILLAFINLLFGALARRSKSSYIPHFLGIISNLN